MENLIEKIEETVRFLKEKNGKIDVAIILGTGLGNDFIKNIDVDVEIMYSDIPHFPLATVEFHKGSLIIGTLKGKRVLVFHGRFHFYEGYSMQEITYPVRIAKGMGVQHLLISNAAGAINLAWKKGELMLINDHINLLPDNPLRGRNNEALGPRFTDMSCPYNNHLNTLLKDIATQLDIPLREGVYASVMGPNLETRAEYRYLKIIGADAVGMSTVPEVIVANHAELPCCAISVLTDECDPDNLEPIDVPEIIAVAGRAEKKLTALYLALIEKL